MEEFIEGGCRSQQSLARWHHLSLGLNPWDGCETLCIPQALPHLGHPTITQPLARSDIKSCEAPENAESTRCGAEHQALSPTFSLCFCSSSGARRRTTSAPVKPLRHKTLLLPSLAAAFLWHLGRIAGRNAFKGNKASAEPLRLGATGKSSRLAAGVHPSPTLHCLRGQ